MDKDVFESLWTLTRDDDMLKKRLQVLDHCVLAHILYAKTVIEHKHWPFFTRQSEYPNLCKRIAFTYHGCSRVSEAAQERAPKLNQQQASEFSTARAAFQEDIEALKVLLGSMIDQCTEPIPNLKKEAPTSIPYEDPLELVIQLLLKGEALMKQELEPSPWHSKRLELEDAEKLLNQKLRLFELIKDRGYKTSTKKKQNEHITGVPKCIMLYMIDGEIKVAANSPRWEGFRQLEKHMRNRHLQRLQVGNDDRIRKHLQMRASPIHSRRHHWDHYHGIEPFSLPYMIQKLLLWSLQDDKRVYMAVKKKEWLKNNEGKTFTEHDKKNHERAWDEDEWSSYLCEELLVVDYRNIEAQPLFTVPNGDSWRRAPPCVTCHLVHPFRWRSGGSLKEVGGPRVLAHGPLFCAENLAHAQLVARFNKDLDKFYEKFGKTFKAVFGPQPARERRKSGPSDPSPRISISTRRKLSLPAELH